MAICIDSVGNLDIILKILEFILSCFTIYIAYRIFKNLDVKKEFTKKQLETVLEFAKELESTNFVFSALEGKSDLLVMNLNPSSILGWAKRHQLWSTSYFTEMKRVYLEFYGKDNVFVKFQSNVFLPKVIAYKIGKFCPETFGEMVDQSDERTDIILLNIANNVDFRDNKKLLYANVEMELYKNTNTYLNGVLDLKQEVIRWLNNYGVKDLNV